MITDAQAKAAIEKIDFFETICQTYCLYGSVINCPDDCAVKTLEAWREQK